MVLNVYTIEIAPRDLILALLKSSLFSKYLGLFFASPFILGFFYLERSAPACLSESLSEWLHCPQSVTSLLLLVDIFISALVTVNRT